MRWFLLVVAAISIARPATGQCTLYQGYGASGSQSISLYVGTGWQDPPPITSAISMWKNGCFGMAGRDFPSLSSGTAGDLSIPVTRVDGRNPISDAGCAWFDAQEGSNGTVIGGVIRIYTKSNAGEDCLWVMPSTTLENLIAHELGHVLGLANATSSECDNYIMGRNWPYASVHPDECESVDEWWDLPGEPEDSPPDPITCETPVCATPIIVSLRGDYGLTSAMNGVAFDIDANGFVEQVSWTNGDADLAFLCMDRNGNGRIDNGSELFGDHTILANGASATHGFEALDELDVNRDGFLDLDDPAWSALMLWFDRDHNGRSSANELVALSDTEVMAVGTDYKWSGKRDSHGNLFRYKGEIILTNGARKFYDVFLQIAPQ
jgi:hypothetical protein